MRLERIDPSRNARRYYELTVAPTLFGGVALVRRWGRIGGAGGAIRIDLFDDLAEARRAFRHWRKAKRGRGYVVAAEKSRR